jgi:hypothetical protein
MSDQALIDYDAILAGISAQTQTALTAVKGNYISNKGKVFTLPGGNQTLPELNCIVIDYIRVNVLLPPYNPKAQINPKCWALGRDDLGMAPSDKCPERQADTCTICAHNQWGSAPNGRPGKACSNTYRLAVVPTDATESSDVWLIKVSPTALNKWTHYVRMAETTHGPAGFLKLITHLSFNQTMEQPSLVFKAIDVHDKLGIILKLRERAALEIMAEPSD